jgi:hypothetical protein
MKLEKVREGMRVVDRHGEKVGVVEEMKMGDPQAVTAEGQGNPHDALVVGVGVLSPVLGVRASGPRAARDVPAEQADRLLRFGYIKVKRGHLLGGHLFVASDDIDHVEDDTVHLAFRL